MAGPTASGMHPGNSPRAILIGGSSHSGKSTLARHLSERLGGTWLSTDSLARHPGRPWPQSGRPVPPHVVEHYATLPVDALLHSVFAHYEGTVWPLAEARIRAQLGEADAAPLVFEGSALWPDKIAPLHLRSVSAIWLTVADAVFERRMRSESRYAEADAGSRALIDKFLARTLAFDGAMMARVRALALPFIEVDEAMEVEELADLVLDRMRPLA